MAAEARVVVIGAGITGLSCAHRLMSLGHEVVLLESDARVGGKIRTVETDGYQFESGPNTLVVNKQAMLDLLAETGLESEIIDAAPSAKKRWITLDGRLCALPTSPIAALTSPLLGPVGVVRALADVFVMGRATGDENESVHAFVQRHFGRRVADNLVGPFLSGVYAGDGKRLEARSVLPTLVEADQRCGSVIRGLIAARRAARKSGKPRLPMRSITLRRGLASLPQRIADLLGERIRLAAPVSDIEEDHDSCRVILATGESIACERVVIATGAAGAIGMIGRVSGGGEIAAAIGRIPHAGISMIGLAYPREAVPHALDGFGYLNGPGSSGPVLGCLFRSSAFAHAAPPGMALLVVFVGGSKHPACDSWGESELVALAEKELQQRLGVPTRPERVFFFRWPAAIPQYEKGHAGLRDSVTAWNARRRISVIGSALTGVSLNDCVAAGRAEAERLGSMLASPARESTLCA